MRKKIFILGIGGLTGSKLSLLAKDGFEVHGSYNLRNPEFDFVEAIQLDITNTEKMRKILFSIHPDIIINACALNSVDYCETHEDEAKKINIDSVAELCKIASQLGSKFVHISSDSIFDGIKNTPYKEEDVPNPKNVYSQTKMIGEKLTLENHNNLVVRASVLYGWLPKKLSTLSSSSMKPTNFAQWLINKLQSHEKIKIITDELSSPTLAEDFAKSILHLVNGNYYGIFHSAPPIQITRYDFSVKLAKSLDLDWNLILPVTNKELGRNVTTGSNKCLDPSKIINKTNFHFLSLDESFNLLKEQIRN